MIGSISMVPFVRGTTRIANPPQLQSCRAKQVPGEPRCIPLLRIVVWGKARLGWTQKCRLTGPIQVGPVKVGPRPPTRRCGDDSGRERGGVSAYASTEASDVPLFRRFPANKLNFRVFRESSHRRWRRAPSTLGSLPPWVASSLVWGKSN